MKYLLLLAFNLLALQCLGQHSSKLKITNEVKQRIDALFSEFDHLDSPG